MRNKDKEIKEIKDRNSADEDIYRGKIKVLDDKLYELKRQNDQ